MGTIYDDIHALELINLTSPGMLSSAASQDGQYSNDRPVNHQVKISQSESISNGYSK